MKSTDDIKFTGAAIMGAGIGIVINGISGTLYLGVAMIIIGIFVIKYG